VAVVGVLAVTVAAGVGFAAGTWGWPVLAAIVGIAIVFAVLYEPLIGVVLLVATIPIENLLVFGGLGTGRAIGVTVFGAWFIRKIVHREPWRRVVAGAFFPTAIAFLVWVLLSGLWAEYPTVVKSGFVRLAQMVLLALITIDLADSEQKLDLIIKSLVLGTLVAASITFYQGEILGARRAGNEVSGGVNETAIMLVTALPLGFYLLRTAGSFVWRLTGMVFVPVCAVSVLTTYSRMNLMLLAPLLCLLFLLTLRERQARSWLLILAVVGGVGAAFLVPWDRLRERADTISTYVDQTLQLEDSQTTQSARGYHLLVGLQIARDHPLLGVGYGNYGYEFRDVYQFQIPGGEKVWESPRNPHSAYVGIAADLGAIGIAIWLALLGACVARIVRAWRIARRAPAKDLLPLVETVGIMLALHVIAYGWYTSHQVDKLLWMIMAMSVVLGGLAVQYVGGVETPSAASKEGHTEEHNGYVGVDLTVL
jgi:O-antigen ligase